MKDLRILSEIATRYGNRNINELEFKTPADFAAYKKKHKMRPGTVVKVAGKDKVVGDDKPKGKKAKVDSVEFSSFGEKDIKRFADRYGVKVSNIKSGQQGVEADFEGDPKKIKKMLTSDDYGMEPEDADDLIGTTPDVDPKIDKDMASAANKANMKMDRDEINGLLNAKDEPFAEEVYDILDDNFEKMGSVGKDLKQTIDTLAAYEMGIYDMSEKEYEEGREEVKKKLDDYYKKQGLDENLKELSQIKTRYGRIGVDKKMVVESFSSGKLRALTNKWQGLDSDFWSYGAKLGIQWEKITDKEIKTNTKPVKKGIEIAYVDKDVTVPGRGRETRYSRNYPFGIDKFTAITVLKDGKPLWYTKSWKPLDRVMTATGKKVEKTRYGSARSNVPDVTAGSRSYSRGKQFGANIYGYQSLSAIMSIPGIKFHHISLEEDQPYMGAGVKRQMRQAAQFGAAKFTTDDEFKRINKQYFDELLRKKLNDPKNLDKKVKQAAQYCNDMIAAALGGKKPTAKTQRVIDMVSGKSSSPEGDAYRFVSGVSDKLGRLYNYYGYYLSALEKQKEEEKKYGKGMDFSKSDAEGYAKDVNQYYNEIMKNRFRF